MSDEHSFSLQRASTEYRDLAGKLREVARACLFPGPRRSLVQLATSFDCQSRPFQLRGRAGRRSVIGETPEWTVWALVRLLVFVMLLPALKR